MDAPLRIHDAQVVLHRSSEVHRGVDADSRHRHFQHIVELVAIEHVYPYITHYWGEADLRNARN